ncbi:MAG: trypsin-like peptidase domain-containing protein [Patescibacteria group bacterium]|nr:trypsin-like peptidase domain-containing protein [Patescibacteria group bacterium]MDE2438625.1 trypsin-like peptidase domain-containing protein [Patescibacteria group bacterium]
MKRISMGVLLYFFVIAISYATFASDNITQDPYAGWRRFLESRTYRLRNLSYWVGSAWVVKTDYPGTIAITAAHCVLDDRTHKPLTNIWCVGPVSFDPATQYSFILRSYDEPNNIAILSSTEHYPLNASEIERTPPQFTDPLFIINRYEAQHKNPVIIGNFLACVWYPSHHVWRDLITNFTVSGCSGAPVFSTDGFVTGMLQGEYVFRSNGFMVRNATPNVALIQALLSQGIHPVLHAANP